MSDWYYQARIVLSGDRVGLWIRENWAPGAPMLDSAEVHPTSWEMGTGIPANITLVYAPTRRRTLVPIVFAAFAIAAVREAFPVLADGAEEVTVSVEKKRREPIEAVADAFLKLGDG